MARWVAGGGGGGGMTGAQIAADPAVKAAFVSQAPAPTGVAATDQAAVQAAIDAATAAGGGVVQLQRGDYAMNAELILKNRVVLRGAGRRATRLVWAADLGTGMYAVRQETGAGIQQDAPSVELLTIQGPVNVSGPNGTAALMDGWRIGRDVNGSEVEVAGFRAGGVIIGDHNTMTRCKFSRNFYNVLYHGTYLTLGNQYWIACNFTGAGFASIAIDGNNVIDGSLFVGGHAGFAPYGIVRIGTAATASMMNTTILDGLSFEVCGNAAIHDSSTTAAVSLTAVQINQPGFSWSSGSEGGWGWRIPELPRDYAVDIRGAGRSWIRSGSAPFTAGDIATYNIVTNTSVVGLEIEEQNTVPSFAGFANNVRLNTGAAKALYRKATTAVTANDLLEVNGTNAVATFGTTGRAFAGVALNTAAVNGWVAVAYDGRVQVNNHTTAVATAGVALKPATGALTKVAPASGTGTGSYANGGAVIPDKWPIVGYSEFDMPANATNRYMWLRGGTQPDRTFVTPGAVTALPTASSTYRGQMLRVEGAAGVADGLYVCMKDAANAYAWRAVTLT